jgi:hypothetical protein
MNFHIEGVSGDYTVTLTTYFIWFITIHIALKHFPTAFNNTHVLSLGFALSLINLILDVVFWGSIRALEIYFSYLGPWLGYLLLLISPGVIVRWQQRK